jgi:hypothetical protein
MNLCGWTRAGRPENALKASAGTHLRADLQAALGDILFIHGRDGLRAVRLIFSSGKKEKNGTARRPSLPKMNI